MPIPETGLAYTRADLDAAIAADDNDCIIRLIEDLLTAGHCIYCFKHRDAPHTVATRAVHSEMQGQTGTSLMCTGPAPIQQKP